ncbi:subtilisin-like protein [Obba rivulosa]|uniref:tripeptidyl-peptidase II n=1 Tax=Obba rivulosa TaxID=1052685 RepID=A0A8E2B2M4_9APHY|nr:subtilisin-like protein [Obba rivulosa]
MVLTRLFLILAKGLSLAAASLSLSSYVVHESRRSISTRWTPVRRAEHGVLLPLRIGLKQENLHSLEEYLLDVSHPNSPNYGKHWASTKVAETFRPSSVALGIVRAWLVDSGLESSRIELSSTGGWLHATVSVSEAESLLATEYYVYQSSEEDVEYLACKGAYHLPEHVSKHVDIVTPTLHFDAKMKRRTSPEFVGRGGQPGTSSRSHGPKVVGPIEDVSVSTELEDCNNQITLPCLRALYKFEYAPIASDKNSLGIAEYTPQAYIPSDLDQFFQNYSKSLVGERPVMVSIDGGTINNNETDKAFFEESNLDLQYSMGLVGKGQPVTLYQVGDLIINGTFNNFLDALDGSYCTFEGGDNRAFDSTYPDPAPGGFKGPTQCGGAPLPYIISTSYVHDETDLTPAYMQRQCAEYAKLGLMGVTVLYASGDGGVAGNDGRCLTDDGQAAEGAPRFMPGFPAECPYVTGVGATQVNPGAKVTDPESACEQGIFSGGGWSNVFAMPDYQKEAVQTYLEKYPPPYPADIWNSTGQSRAFPDIAVNGANYLIVVQGKVFRVSGTSASSPVLAAILSAVNDARLAVGKSPIGFINPTIYSAAFEGVLNDITNGSNPGCGTNGFAAQPGWDPVTGLGTPNFPKMLSRWLELP